MCWQRVLQVNALGLAESQLNPLVPKALLSKLDVSKDTVSSSISCLLTYKLMDLHQGGVLSPLSPVLGARDPTAVPLMNLAFS